MKKLLLLFFTFHFSHFAFSQGTWSPRSPLPDSAMFQGISGFAIGNYGYAGLGNYSGANITFNKFWQFDPSTNSWTRKADFPGKARIAPASFVIGNKAYLVTGSVANFGACVRECWQYDATNDTWTQKAKFPGTARTYAVGFAIGGKGYVGAGAAELNDFRKDFFAYDTATDTWTRIADFGGIARSGASGFTVNGKGYVCLGQDSTIKYYGDMWEYDTGSNSWTRKANIPDSNASPHLSASGFAICNNIYIGCGDDSAFHFSHQFWKYNTVLDTWTQEANVPGITKVQGAAFAIGDTGYYGFGADSVTQVHNIFDKFFANDSCNSNMGYNIINDISKISVYPNPNNGIFTVQLSEDNGQSSVEVYNLLGQKINIEMLKKFQNIYEINFSNQTSGIYILSINLANQIYYKKIIINH